MAERPESSRRETLFFLLANTTPRILIYRPRHPNVLYWPSHFNLPAERPWFVHQETMNSESKRRVPLNMLAEWPKSIWSATPMTRQGTLLDSPRDQIHDGGTILLQLARWVSDPNLLAEWPQLIYSPKVLAFMLQLRCATRGTLN